ncbi:serine hydrolase domain-containing protein [Alkalihalobacterium elongatum]|uniref:serine hydrolase domain-containing protein n=1 Tax=Alkalihalobacterium elongatum TaxID=2675466 RepID=UPI001C1F6974|nr:serine hydrolase domain-containing protein [Alkalihalobacterium elongatum]
MGKKLDAAFLEQTVHQMTKKKNNFGAVLCVERGDDFSWTGSAGNLQKDDRYFIASVTKLYVTAVILKLKAEKKLDLDDPIMNFLPEEVMDRLHVYSGIDYSKEITIKHLISNTSGLPDYFSYKQSNGKTVAAELFTGKDQTWTLDETLMLVKQLKPKFKPGQKGKVNYSDTNYQLLGRIIENITGSSMRDVFHSFIFDELGLTDTYVYSDESDTSPAPIYYKSAKLHLPHYMTSITPEGGIVSTAKESMLFLKAFFNGRFFQKEEIERLKQWNKIYFPGQFYYGIGLEKLWTPRVLSPIHPIKEILGFWGQSGAFAFYNPERNVYFTGTVNQLSGYGHSAAYQAMIRILKRSS